MTQTPPKFVLLTILDGWGLAPNGPGNAITIANTINMDKFRARYPHGELDASGEAVGLPKGEDGNTETGHLNLGAGKIVYQDLQRINLAIGDQSFYKNEILLSALAHVRTHNSKLHFMGLLGRGGVHSNMEHLFALIHFAKLNTISEVYIHAFTDGRDSPQTGSKTYIKQLQDVLEKEGVGKIASITGRYYAMDRDQRWDRTEKAYNALTSGVGHIALNAESAIDASYAIGNTDEFIEPTLIAGADGKPLSLISDNDAVVFFNFRIDRPRQLTKAFIFENLVKSDLTFEFNTYNVSGIQSTETETIFKRDKVLKNLFFVTMTDYGKLLTDNGAHPAFPPEIIQEPLSAVVANEGFSQLKITESEKERFVTFYFNGHRESAYPLEERIIIPSAKVPTYDQKPEMSANEITETLLKRLNGGDYKLVVVNFPNADMVGHTGNIGAAVSGIELVDACLGKLANFALAYGGAMVITSDHGNAEEMINMDTKEIDTEHSVNRVPFIVVSKDFEGKAYTLRSGKLADVAPTILSMLGITPPSSMTGVNLLLDIN